MATSARFPEAARRAGMYESFYMRAVSPHEPRGVWIRYTVHKRPGAQPRGSLWFTLFDPGRDRPLQHKLTSARLGVPDGGWIAVDDAEMGPCRVHGSCGAASWELRFSACAPELRHLSPAWLYRAPLPRTKLTSPAPAAVFDGSVELADGTVVELAGWPGMVGHNWGSEHAERWIWLNGLAFEQDPRAWIDVALGRLAVAGRLTPWVANGSLCIGARRYRLGGLSARGQRVRESAAGCELLLRGEDGLTLEANASFAGGSAAGWRYADPDGGEHDVVNCSVATLELALSFPGGRRREELRSAHGGAFELGTRERDHGVPIAPFPDG